MAQGHSWAPSLTQTPTHGYKCNNTHKEFQRPTQAHTQTHKCNETHRHTQMQRHTQTGVKVFTLASVTVKHNVSFREKGLSSKVWASSVS